MTAASSTPQALAYAVTPHGAERLAVPGDARGIHELFDDLALGIYEALRTFGRGRFLHLERHLGRADQALQVLGWEPLDRAALCRSLQQAADEWPGREARIRFDVLAAPAQRFGTQHRVLLALEELRPVADAVLEEGVRLGVARGKHRRQPRIKNARWVLDRRGLESGDPGLFEYLLLDDAEECILECTSANFFGVRGDCLHTAGEGMLEGVTRSIVLEVARELRVEVRLEKVALRDLPELNEAFLTSSSRGVVPVVHAAGQPIGTGRPGPVTARILEGYRTTAAQSAQPAWPLPEGAGR